MNRKQRREAVKKLRGKGYSKATAEGLIGFLRDHDFTPPGNFQDGDKVRVNVEQIRRSKDWPGMNPKYKAFVEENEDTVFTVRMERPLLATFEEDSTWWFYTGDLIHAEEEQS